MELSAESRRALESLGFRGTLNPKPLTQIKHGHRDFQLVGSKVDRGALRLQAIPHYPKGPRTQIIVLGPKYHVYYSICALKPYYWGPWTLRVTLGPEVYK